MGEAHGAQVLARASISCWGLLLNVQGDKACWAKVTAAAVTED